MANQKNQSGQPQQSGQGQQARQSQNQQTGQQRLQECQAIDWQALLQKLGPWALQAVITLITLLQQQQVTKAEFRQKLQSAGCDEDECNDCCDRLHADLDEQVKHLSAALAKNVCMHCILEE